MNMNWNKVKASLLLLVLFSVNLQAQNKLSLTEALDFAYKNNRSMIVSDQQIKASKKKKWEVVADGLPQVDGNISYNHWIKQQLSLIPGAMLQEFDKEYVAVAMGTKHNTTATLGITQKLFDASYLVGMQSAKLFLEISKNQSEKSQIEVKRQVTEAYVNVLIGYESISITKENIKNLKQNLHETEQLFGQGLTEEENVEQLKITLGELENNLLSLKHQGYIAENLLKILLGINIAENVELTDSLDALIASYSVLNLKDDSYVIDNNIDYRMAKNRVRAKELELKLERSKALPSLNLSFQAAAAGYGAHANKALKTSDMLTSKVLMLNMKIPIFSSLKRNAASQRKRIELYQNQLQFQDLEEQLNLQLIKARDAFKLSVYQWNTTKRNLELSERIANKNQTKFNRGLISSFDLRQAQLQLYATQQEYLGAVHNIVRKKIELETIINK
jgi:outer membrane protein TolC